MTQKTLPNINGYIAVLQKRASELEAQARAAGLSESDRVSLEHLRSILRALSDEGGKMPDLLSSSVGSETKADP
jgi:hypothetical protein